MSEQTPMTPEQTDFYLKLQKEIQEALNKVLMDNGQAAADLDVSVGDAAYCIGSSVASSLFELFRENGQSMLDDDNQEFMANLLEAVKYGFNKKVELLAEPDDALIKFGNPSTILH